MKTRYGVGDRVTVRVAYPPGHVRTPYFLRGKGGEIDAVVGAYANPEELAYGRAGTPEVTLYRVRFPQGGLWPDYSGPSADSLVADIYEHWLEPGEK